MTDVPLGVVLPQARTRLPCRVYDWRERHAATRDLAYVDQAAPAIALPGFHP